jgi:hypothetical protein
MCQRVSAAHRINLNLDDFAAFVGEKVPAHADGVCTIGKVQSLHQVITPSMTRTLPDDTPLTNKSQPFSIVWVDNTDSICDLQCS